MKSKLLVILGATATGKSSLAVTLAREFKGEVISADSRHVYKGFDIGTGKITEKEQEGVPHHLIDIRTINQDFSVADFKKEATAAVRATRTRRKLPIVAGGTGFYIKALVDDITLPSVPPNKQLRAKLESKSPKELFEQLAALDKERAETIDQKNPRRLVRAIEIATQLGTVPSLETDFPPDYSNSQYNVLQIGLTMSDDELREKIWERTKTRLKDGWAGEVWQLIQSGVSWDRITEFGLGYRCIIEFFEKKLDEHELPECIATSEWQYAKRQRQWFTRDKRIEWFHPNEEDKIRNTVRAFIGK